MKPFTAWLAMGHSRKPFISEGFEDTRRVQYRLTTSRRACDVSSPAEPQPVLIVADTPENRKKLGMEE